jgi:hypothetical protein
LRFVEWFIVQFGKAPGYACLTFAALLSASLLCASGCIAGGEYVGSLGIILGAHFGAGVAVARRDQPAAKIEGGKPPLTAGGDPVSQGA